MKYTKGSFITVPNQEALRGLDCKAQCLFMWLCFHANQEGKCFPSRKTLGLETGLGITSIKNAIKVLVDAGLIVAEHRKNGKENMTNLYEVLIFEGERNQGGVGRNTPQVGRHTAQGVGRHAPGELNPSSLTQSTQGGDELKNSPRDWGKEIPLILEYFVKINPSITYGNKTQRGAVEKMLEKWGFDAVEAMVRKVISVQGQQYAPVADTPAKMWNKLGEFGIYFKKQNTGVRGVNLNEM